MIAYRGCAKLALPWKLGRIPVLRSGFRLLGDRLDESPAMRGVHGLVKVPAEQFQSLALNFRGCDIPVFREIVQFVE